VLLLFFGSMAIVLNTNWFQQKLTDTVIRDFKQRTGATLTIDKVGYNIYSGLELHVIHLKDRKGKPILSAERIDGAIQLLPLLHQEIRFQTIRLIRANLYLSKKTTSSPLNIQFILDAYKTKKRVSKNWDINFNTILLRNCKVHYDVTSLPIKEGTLDPNHLDLQDISAKMAFKATSGLRYKFSVTKFQAREKSGLHIDQVQMEGIYSETALKVSNFSLISGNSNLRIQGLIANFRKTNNRAHFLDSIQIQPVIVHIFVVPSEFSFLSESVTKFNKPIKVDVCLEGNL